MKKFWCVLPFLWTAVSSIYIFLGGKPFLIISSDSSFHFNLITVNALFGGFLYTNYTLLVGLLDKALIKKVAHTQIIRKRNSHILKGIVYSVISIACSLFLILISENDSRFFQFIYCLIENAEITFMFFLIFYFLLSLKEMNTLVNALHPKDGAKSELEMKNLKQKILENSKK